MRDVQLRAAPGSCCSISDRVHDLPFEAREFIAGKDPVTLATDILTLDQDAFSAAFRKSPMKRTKLEGLRRNTEVILQNDSTASYALDTAE